MKLNRTLTLCLLGISASQANAQSGYSAFPTGATCYATQAAACNAWLGWRNYQTGATIVESIPNGALLRCMVRYSDEPEGYPTSSAGLGLCTTEQPRCPVEPLSPITDAASLEHEGGAYRRAPDLDRVTVATRTGAACILAQTQSLGQRAIITSAYRPGPYQLHLREVWDKWQILRGNTDTVCREVRQFVQREWDKHQLVRQPGTVSNHSAGTAVDISGVPEISADAVALTCSMQRPLADDPVHYQPR